LPPHRARQNIQSAGQSVMSALGQSPSVTSRRVVLRPLSLTSSSIGLPVAITAIPFRRCPVFERSIRAVDYWGRGTAFHRSKLAAVQTTGRRIVESPLLLYEAAVRRDCGLDDVCRFSRTAAANRWPRHGLLIAKIL
jgi:hypothetical protein